MEFAHPAKGQLPPNTLGPRFHTWKQWLLAVHGIRRSHSGRHILGQMCLWVSEMRLKKQDGNHEPGCSHVILG